MGITLIALNRFFWGGTCKKKQNKTKTQKGVRGFPYGREKATAAFLAPPSTTKNEANMKNVVLGQKIAENRNKMLGASFEHTTGIDQTDTKRKENKGMRCCYK